MRVLVKRILKKYGYPPDLSDAAVQTVLAQAEVLLRELAAWRVREVRAPQLKPTRLSNHLRVSGEFGATLLARRATLGSLDPVDQMISPPKPLIHRDFEGPTHFAKYLSELGWRRERDSNP